MKTKKSGLNSTLSTPRINLNKIIEKKTQPKIICEDVKEKKFGNK